MSLGACVVEGLTTQRGGNGRWTPLLYHGARGEATPFSKIGGDSEGQVLPNGAGGEVPLRTVPALSRRLIMQEDRQVVAINCHEIWAAIPVEVGHSDRGGPSARREVVRQLERPIASSIENRKVVIA